MCGRDVSFLPAEAVARMFHTVNPLPNAAPSWNVAPTQSGMVVGRHPETSERHLDLLGLAAELDEGIDQGPASYQCASGDRRYFRLVPWRFQGSPLHRASRCVYLVCGVIEKRGAAVTFG